MAKNVAVEIASKILVTLGAGAGALLAKAATEKGLGTVIKAIQEKKNAVEDIIDVDPTEVVTETMGGVEEVVEKAAEVAEEVSGA